MKKFIALLLCGILTATALTGCGSSSAGGENGEVIVYNWGEYIDPETLDMFEEENYNYIGHIEYGQHADMIVVAPATANIIGKVSSGIADDMLSSTIIASTKPVLFVPAMNEHMYLNKIVQNNMEKLKSYGYLFLEPEVGMLACGTSGIGKLPNTKVIFDKIKEVLSEER